MANIRSNTSYGAGTYGEPNYSAGCCEWCDDNARGNAIKYPPVGCNDAMCSDPTFASGCSGQGYGQITSRPTVNPFPITSTEEYNFSGFYNQSGGGCPCQYPISGCTNFLANNYNSLAVTNDGSCTFSGTCYPQGCVSQGVPSPGSSYNNLTSQGCSSLGNYQSTPANCGTPPFGGGPTRSFSGHSNANGFTSY